MKTLGILADKPTASTGFAIVCSNLAERLTRYFRVIYFGRFGQERGFAPQTQTIGDFSFEYVPCEGGVWKAALVSDLIKHYDVDILFSEDDWFSAHNMVGAANFWKVPFHLLTPIDSLPLNPRAFDEIFTRCDKIYIPNSSYEIFDGRKRRMETPEEVIERTGEKLKAVSLPHGVDASIFFPRRVKRFDEFTFLWIGRAETRKAPGRAILAFEQICHKIDARLFMRTDWTTPVGTELWNYITKRNLPVICSQTADIPHFEMGKIYNMGDVFVCTSKAGGFEMGIIEAAASSIPSIVTDWTFMNENVVHGKSGLLVPIESNSYPPPSHSDRQRIWGDISIDKLAETMYWCYLNQTEVKAMGRWARDYVVEKYNWDVVAKKLAKELKE